ncbi:MAG: ABC transporter permease [Lachnospiraceae bacterium]|nr:ABC transporter permease [Lachnospiraceae bacterium]
MFLHLFKYRFLSFVREKSMIFWILVFPIILGTCFYLAFGKINEKSENFTSIPVAVVMETKEDGTAFQDFMSNLKTKEDTPFFKVTYTTRKKGEKLLKDKKVDGLILYKDGTPHLTITESGYNATIIKTVLERYIQSAEVVISAYKKNPAKVPGILETLSEGVEIKENKLTSGNPDNILEYFYALIAMASLFSSLTGRTLAWQAKANKSAVGMRKTCGATHRLTVLLADFCASLFVHAISSALLVTYLLFVLKINLGVSFLATLAISLSGAVIGLCVGLIIGSIPGLSEGTQIGLNVGFTLFSSFLSGLMMGDMKRFIEASCPLINHINPATLISNALYSLNIYDNYDRFLINIFTMLGLSVFLIITSYFMTRRETYDSL